MPRHRLTAKQREEDRSTIPAEVWDCFTSGAVMDFENERVVAEDGSILDFKNNCLILADGRRWDGIRLFPVDH